MSMHLSCNGTYQPAQQRGADEHPPSQGPGRWWLWGPDRARWIILVDWTHPPVTRWEMPGLEQQVVNREYFLTFSSHFLLVNDKDVLKDASHSARCHEMGAVVVDEFGIHAIVVGVRKLLQGQQHIFIQNNVVPSHLETGCLHLRHTSNERNLLQVKKRGAATQRSFKKTKSNF